MWGGRPLECCLLLCLFCSIVVSAVSNDAVCSVRCVISNSCVASSSDCVTEDLTCSNETTPYYCVGQCRQTPLDCPSRACATQSKPYECWNKQCEETSQQCVTLPACPSFFSKRCWDGSCVASSDTCPTDPGCAQGELRCPNGKCVASTAACEPYNGCPVSTPIQCADGTCASLVGECMCSDGVRCWVRNCRANASLCMPAPASLKPISANYTVASNGSVGVWASILDQNEAQLIANITVSSTSNTPTQFIVSSLADSVVEAIRHSSWQSSDVSAYNVYSPVLNIQPISAPSGVELTITFIYSEALPIANQLCLAQATGNTWKCVDNDVKNITIANGTSSVALSARSNAFGTFAVINVQPIDNDRVPQEHVPPPNTAIYFVVGACIGGAAVIGFTILSVMLIRKHGKFRIPMEETELPKDIGSAGAAASPPTELASPTDYWSGDDIVEKPFKNLRIVPLKRFSLSMPDFSKLGMRIYRPKKIEMNEFNEEEECPSAVV